MFKEMNLFSEIFWGEVLAKKAIIVVALVEESEEKEECGVGEGNTRGVV
jgi:hypothetical protein